MSQILRSQSFVRAAATAASIAALAPATALAADAPLRSTNYDASGARTQFFTPYAVSSDGHEIFGDILGQTVIRDVAAGTTRPLDLGGAQYSASSYPPQASDDLERIAFSTSDALSPDDTNGGPDVYVYDRRTGKDILVSVDPATHHLPPAGASTGAYDFAISRDGNAVEFTGRQFVTASNPAPIDTQWRYDLTTNTLTKGPVGNLRTREIDAAGRVNVSTAGVTAGGRTFPIPNIGTQSAVVSRDGSTVGYWGPHATRLTLQNTTTGTTRTVAVPSAIVTSDRAALRLVGSGGDTAVLSTIVKRNGLDRTVFSSLDTRTAVNTQLGGDIEMAYASPSPISPNLAFVATTTSLAQLGSLPLPGTEGAPESTPSASSYAGVQDSYCTKKILGLFWTSYTQPAFQMHDVATQPGVPTAVRADATITKDGAVIANLTLTTPGSSKNFNAGRFGGWSAHITVTLSNGIVESTDVDVPVHGNPVCTF